MSKISFGIIFEFVKFCNGISILGGGCHEALLGHLFHAADGRVDVFECGWIFVLLWISVLVLQEGLVRGKDRFLDLFKGIFVSIEFLT